jgi:hypothetical protein
MHTPPAARPRLVPLVLIGGGMLALAAGVVVGGDATAAGAVAFLCACALALGEATRSIVTWPNAVLAFVAVIWFVPIRLYSLPVTLPFELELYRLLILLMVLAFVMSAIQTGREVDAVGAGKPLYALALAALTSQAIHTNDLAASGTQSQALKSLSFFLSFVVIFLLVASTIDSVRDVDKILAGLVIGGAVVSLVALYEARTHYNVFDHLDAWLPFSRNEREILALRGGRLRVHSSAQHPIALGAALIMVVPLAMYLAQKAARGPKAIFWNVAGGIILVGAIATISRTVVVMGIAMLILGVWLRPKILPKVLPVLLVIPIVAHAAAPGALGGLAHSFGIGGGKPLIESVQGRPGQAGSGRLDDIEPGLRMWSRSPLVGLGIDSSQVATSGVPASAQVPRETSGPAIIFDNQYLRTLVSLGLIGLIGAVWFVWGSAIRLARRSKHLAGDDGDLLAACAITCAGYAAGMAFFDSFSFVQATLIFFIVAALGLKARALVRAQIETRPATSL